MTSFHPRFAIQWLTQFVILTVTCISAARPMAQDRCPDVKGRSDMSYNSFFGQQFSHLSTETKTLRIELDGRKPSQDCPSSYQFSFHATLKTTQVVSRFGLCNDTEQVDQIEIISSTRVLVLGRLAADAPVANILELTSGKVIDHFSCFMPSVSPNHRFLAFVKGFPGHPGPVNISAEYLVYDLTGTPDYNRPGSTSHSSGVGWPVYPRDATNSLQPKIVPEGTPYHSWTSQALFWTDDDTLVFADKFQGENELVTAKLSAGVGKLRVGTVNLDASELIDLSRCKQSYSQEDFQSISEEPAGLVRIDDIQSVKPGWLCLRFVPNACLKYETRMLEMP